jgi:hypothetical protein
MPHVFLLPFVKLFENSFPAFIYGLCLVCLLAGSFRVMISWFMLRLKGSQSLCFTFFVGLFSYYDFRFLFYLSGCFILFLSVSLSLYALRCLVIFYCFLLLSVSDVSLSVQLHPLLCFLFLIRVSIGSYNILLLFQIFFSSLWSQTLLSWRPCFSREPQFHTHTKQ